MDLADPGGFPDGIGWRISIAGIDGGIARLVTPEGKHTPSQNGDGLFIWVYQLMVPVPVYGGEHAGNTGDFIHKKSCGYSDGSCEIK